MKEVHCLIEVLPVYILRSIYKLIIAASVLENPDVDTRYNCTGTITIEGYSWRMPTGHGFLI